MRGLFDFMQLVANENMKTYRRIRTWIMLGILLVLAAGTTIVFYSITDEIPNMWMVTELEATFLSSLITIFVVIVAAESVASEFSTGTIKLLLIRPWSRSKILLSKYISLMLLAVFFTAVVFVFTVLMNMIVFGYSSELELAVGSADNMAPLPYMLMFYLYNFISLVVVATLAFMISSVFRSSGLAIGLSIFLTVGGGNILVAVLGMFQADLVDYILFTHLDITGHLSAGETEYTLGFSLGVLAVYYAIFMVLAWYVFKKRDVAA
ncbi:ABC transporter permease [Paenibacillus tarimensis]|uniref:ABC transporter permease n=1 Tax=Paenibacillus tarimensis TaxID=416012 RepID=UPI0039EEA8E2